mgnify:FL=1
MRIDALLNALDEKELRIIEATLQAWKAAKEAEAEENRDENG